METFYFSLDTKVTDWYRTDFEIEANSQEEANELAIKFVKERQHDTIGWEQLDNALENLSVGDNGGQPTEELRTDEFDEIWDNTKE